MGVTFEKVIGNVILSHLGLQSDSVFLDLFSEHKKVFKYDPKSSASF